MTKLTPRQSAIVSVLDKELDTLSLDLNVREERDQPLIRSYLITERCYSPEMVDEYLRHKRERGNKKR